VGRPRSPQPLGLVAAYRPQNADDRSPQDCYFGHWMKVDGRLQPTAALRAGDTVTLEIESIKDWPEPNVPQDLESTHVQSSRTPALLGRLAS
jgi:hypothetical protein